MIRWASKAMQLPRRGRSRSPSRGSARWRRRSRRPPWTRRRRRWPRCRRRAPGRSPWPARSARRSRPREPCPLQNIKRRENPRARAVDEDGRRDTWIESRQTNITCREDEGDDAPGHRPGDARRQAGDAPGSASRAADRRRRRVVARGRRAGRERCAGEGDRCRLHLHLHDRSLALYGRCRSQERR
jgi:hypothetical protein